MSATPSPKLRRNGRMQACEPCRKGKLGCNHAQPHCGRCVRRKMTAQCIYHPAPMTKSSTPTLGGAIPTPPASTPTHELITTGSTTMPLNGMLNTPRDASAPSLTSSLQSQPRKDSQFSETSSSTAGQANTNWANWSHQGVAASSDNTLFKPALGLTTYSAVFAENRAKFAEILEIGKESDADIVAKEQEASAAACLTVGIQALRLFPNYSICQRFFDVVTDFCDSVLPLNIAQYIAKTIWTTYGDVLAEPRDLTKLAAMAETLCKNGLKQLHPSPSKAQDWLDTFTGTNLRWETLGMLYCCFGMGVHALQDWDSFFDPKSPEFIAENRMLASSKLKECAFMCLEMCSQSDTANEFVSLLLVGVGLLESVVDGDESFRLWRRHSDTVTFSMAVGLHRLPDPSLTPPTAASLFRLKVFAALYNQDQSFSTFRGRPPSFSRRYCNRWLLYDLDDDAFFADPEELQERISRLGPDGWNYDGRVREATWTRAMMILLMIREEILEVSLSIDPNCDSELLESLRRRCDQAYSDFPKALHLSSDDVRLQADPERLLFFRILTRLWYLHNIFLIYRTAATKARTNCQNLLDTANEMLSTVLLFWKNQQRLIAYNSTFEWMITCYGLPPAGVLTVELLKHARRAQECTLRFSRSSVIQSLTLFCSFLEWVRPTDGNYKLCVRLRKVILRILDFVLNESNKEAPTIEENTEVERTNTHGTGSNSRPPVCQPYMDTVGSSNPPPVVNNQSFESMAVGPGSFEEMDFWLSTVDWTGQAPWADMNI